MKSEERKSSHEEGDGNGGDNGAEPRKNCAEPGLARDAFRHRDNDVSGRKAGSNGLNDGVQFPQLTEWKHVIYGSAAI